MKKILLYCFVAFIALSCANGNHGPQIVDETFAPEQEELYSQCSDLKGIADLIIGQTTFKQASQSRLFAEYYSWQLSNNFYNGHWGQHNHDLSDWIEKQSKHIKQLEAYSPKIKIGEIVFDDFDLAFYDNKLAAIYFKVDSHNKVNLHQHYLDKYGNGRGSYYSYHKDNEPCRNRDNLVVSDSKREERFWENEKVMLEYHLHYNFEMSPYKKSIDTYVNSSWYLLQDKTLYPLFLEELNKQKKAFEQNKKDKESESLKQF